ncbi:MAG TPA: TrmB family transcriptional regulator sugar-binding domain-containing protein, partial [Actinomycetes bacterium]|nr:TrmB family transcriptional regulator sugar-binding domain-containing protein [Actinomycetes bacterium]
MESNLTAVEQGLAQLGHEQDTKLTWSLSGHGHVVDSMRRAIDRTRERLTAALPSAELDELTPALRAAAERGVTIDLVAGDGTAPGLPEAEGVRVRRRPGGAHGKDRLAVVLGDGQEIVLADLGLARPEGMWTHHPAVALLVAEHLRDLA